MRRSIRAAELSSAHPWVMTRVVSLRSQASGMMTGRERFTRMLDRPRVNPPFIQSCPLHTVSTLLPGLRPSPFKAVAGHSRSQASRLSRDGVSAHDWPRHAERMPMGCIFAEKGTTPPY